MNLDPNTTALVIVDPQVDFLKPESVVWDLVGEMVEKNNVLPHLVELRNAADAAGIPVLYSPHHFNDKEYKSWEHLNTIDKVMFDRRMFDTSGRGADIVDELTPNENTFVLSPHKALSGFWANDINLQLRQRNIQTIVLAGMSANLCVESHLRDAAENGFDVIVVTDATAGAGEDATNAAYVNYGFIASETVTTAETVAALGAARAA
ncbi:MAG: cysteine hydrolase [Acidimicrobiia bacterium]